MASQATTPLSTHPPQTSYFLPHITTSASASAAQVAGLQHPLAFKESEVITIDWKLTNLKALFETSRGDSKSRVVKSVLFGGARWQLLFYPNAGGGSQDWCSLYLSCEPTLDEYDEGPPPPTASTFGQTHTSAQSNGAGKSWSRKGVYQFKFAICSDEGKTFSSKTANWGWAQYAKRDVVYYNQPQVKSADTFLITCSISTVPAPPKPPSTIPKRNVPQSLLLSVGRMLNDPIYSDVEFILPSRDRYSGLKEKRKVIYANRTLLNRSDYFETMLSSGFMEGFNQEEEESSVHGSQTETESHSEFLDPPFLEDSDSSDLSSDEEEELENEPHGFTQELSAVASPSSSPFAFSTIAARMTSDSDQPAHADRSVPEGEGLEEAAKLNPHLDGLVEGEGLSKKEGLVDSTNKSTHTKKRERSKDKERAGHILPGPRKRRVIVRDASYPTFYALLYYLYTDSIAFAPLTSSFIPLSAVTNHVDTSGATVGSASSESHPSKLRRLWIEDWSKMNPERPEPVSPKSMYVLADKIGLEELKSLSFEHIILNLTVQNIPHECFSAFSASFDDVRKTQVAFFLKNWAEIKRTNGMKIVWDSLRSGKHLGFEEVWPLIVSQLEYVPLALQDPAGQAAV
ncbi:TRAF-like [Phaffia rhodozyma]|uniref:TRAF-like n=1 Tax=Phaffia rhodozyma TaxID=264483 RepID=A0A0F7STK1_PHARH|nr:TRAF-like [Phaffia rhodozyma]